ncbi:MAG: DUF11 domain-containing protein [Planctomycetota bacterium]|nr:DUF11 domain-containing protein [Planctomycetota bacterium]
MSTRGARWRAWAIASVAVVAACGPGGRAARAQLVVGSDQVPPTIWLIDLSGVREPRALVTGIACHALAADDAGGVLYWTSGQALYRASYHPTDALVPVGPVALSGSAVITGLAYDALERRLIGRGTGGLYEVNPLTGACTLLHAMTAQDFGGLDYDAQSDTFIAANDTGNQTVLPGRGVYRISKPLTNPTFTRLALYPGEITDVDGLATGDAVAYLVRDSAGEQIERLDLTSGVYLSPLASPFTLGGISAGGAWAPGLLPMIATADVSAALTAPASCGVATGEVGTWVVRVRNAGPQPSEGVVLRVLIPATAGFESSVPATAAIAGGRQLAIGTLAAGAEVVLTLQLRGLARGPLPVTAVVQAATVDPGGTNNQATTSTTVARPAPTEASARAVLSTVATSPTSLVPGLEGVRVAPGGLGRVFKSPSGSRWISRVETDAPPATREVVLAWSADFGPQTVARAGDFPLIPGDPPAPAAAFEPVVAIDDAGTWACAGKDAREAPGDAFVYTQDAQGGRVAAREGQPAPALGGVSYADDLGGVALAFAGEICFGATLTGTAPGFAQALFGLDGFYARAQAGANFPLGQRNGNTFPYGAFDRRGAASHMVDEFGVRFLAGGTIADGPGFDRVLIVDHEVFVQEGVRLRSSSFVSPARAGEPLRGAHMESTGAWFAWGSNDDGTHWVLYPSGVLTHSGQPVTPGAAERWRGGPPDAGFVLACGNRGGSLLVGGLTDDPDPTRDSVLVLDGAVILREGDPVDLNANGVFDDGVYIRGFVNGAGVLSDAGVVTVLVSLRDAGAALCDGPDIEVGQAIVTWPVAPAGPSCEPDYTQDGNVDQDDIACLVDLVAGGSVCDASADPDFNRDGNVDQADISDLVSVVGGSACP